MAAPSKGVWYCTISEAQEQQSPKMASQVQRWALLHSEPWRAFVCPIVHLGCVPLPKHEVGDELGAVSLL